MRIGIDANPLLGDRGGVAWHTAHLLRALLDLKEEVEFVCYIRPGTVRQAFDALAVPNAGTRLHWVEAGKLTMRWRGRLDHLDLYHGTNFKMQTTGLCGGLVTIHDLWLDRYPQYSKKLLGQRISFYRTRRTAWRARKVITVSNYSARDIEDLYGLSRERIAVIPNGVSEDFVPRLDAAAMSELRRRLNLPSEEFILFVGGADPRKNHQTLLKAYASRKASLENYYLVLVGDPIHQYGNIRETARIFGIEDRVVCTGRLPVTDLQILYSHAGVFVFPSIYEGFGMPVLEAMACGAPVLTSNSTSLPEVAGDAAILVNPEDPEALADAMCRVLADRGLRDELRVKGLKRVKQFTWVQVARQTLVVYHELCRDGGRSVM